MAKKELSEKQKEIIEKNKFSTDCPEVARKNQKKSVEKRRKNKEEKIKRENGTNFIWENFFGTKEQFIEFWKSLKPKEKKDVLLKILPQDVQKQEITNTTPQIVVASQKDADILKKIANVKPD